MEYQLEIWRKDLLALAETQKSFRTLALQHVWHVQVDGLWPLLRVLLGDSIKGDSLPDVRHRFNAGFQLLIRIFTAFSSSSSG
jgi:hypothetical protein